MGETLPSTALELMKSRYSAYATGAGEYLVETTSRANRYPGDAELINEFAQKNEWLSLEIVNTPADDIVEFKAFYREGEAVKVHHEKSWFVMEEGAWRYDRCELFETKIGRNDPCPCGSGKKYKRCCA
jgi:SEC-C motif-containing protein